MVPRPLSASLRDDFYYSMPRRKKPREKAKSACNADHFKSYRSFKSHPSFKSCQSFKSHQSSKHTIHSRSFKPHQSILHVVASPNDITLSNHTNPLNRTNIVQVVQFTQSSKSHQCNAQKQERKYKTLQIKEQTKEKCKTK